jgi:hypothetical protein
MTFNRLGNRWLGTSLTALTVSLAPVYAHAQSVTMLTKAVPADGYYANSYPPGAPFRSWLDMVSASQAAQPSWMTPLVTVTPRLEQEFRYDQYDQKNGSGSQGNGQRLIEYGGPGGARVEFIPSYDWEVILAPPAYVTATGPKGTASGVGDWPAFLVKYRLASANEANGNYIVTAFFQMTDALGTSGKISTNVTTAQPTIAFGKGWGDFDIQSIVSVQIPVGALNVPGGDSAQTNIRNFGDPIL